MVQLSSALFRHHRSCEPDNDVSASCCQALALLASTSAATLLAASSSAHTSLHMANVNLPEVNHRHSVTGGVKSLLTKCLKRRQPFHADCMTSKHLELYKASCSHPVVAAADQKVSFLSINEGVLLLYKDLMAQHVNYKE